MDREILLWIWLADCLGIENSRVKRIFEIFGNAVNIYFSNEKELRLSGIFTQREIQKLSNKNVENAKKVLYQCENLGYDIFSYKDYRYPSMLKEIPQPPVLIYVSGRIPTDDALSVAVVGTREATLEGRRKAFDISYELAKNNTVIVSGGANGIDIQAHMGAMRAGGKTICVTGCGINYNYPKNTEEIRRQIPKYGAIISEYPPDTEPAQYTFPKRNRIIAGITHCTLVIEAKERSGALITAKYAAKQNKKIFAFPGRDGNIYAKGPRNLIQEGAETAKSYQDILNWYRLGGEPDLMKKRVEMLLKNYFNDPDESSAKKTKRKVHNAGGEISNTAPPLLYQTEKKETAKPAKNNTVQKNTYKKQSENKNNKEDLKKIPKEQLTGNAAAVYHTISDIPIHVDSIKTATGLNISEILIILTELELSGYISSVSGRRYVLNKK